MKWIKKLDRPLCLVGRKVSKKTIHLNITIDYRDYLRVGEAAKLLGVHPQSLRNWDNAGKLKAYRHSISNYRLYKLIDINKLLEEIKK
jgi:excisionase family DNA binding protein